MTQNHSNQAVQLTSCRAEKKTFKTQNQINQVQLTTYIRDKQKDIQNTKSEQSSSTTHQLHGRQAERHSEHKTRAIS